MNVVVDKQADTKPKEAPSTERIEFKDAKPSEWIESLPLDFFESGACRSGEHQFCGIGLIAEFYGFDWHMVHRGPLNTDEYFQVMDDAIEFANAQTGAKFPYETFDIIYHNEGVEGAKNFTVNWLKERGL